MGATLKPQSQQDESNAIRGAYNEVDKTISVNGFLVGRIGHKVTMTISTTSISNDTETYAFTDNGTALYSIRVIYTTGTRDVMISAERIA